MVIDKIFESIRLEEEKREWGNPVRMSNAGKCQRAIAYQFHKFQAEPLRVRSRLALRMGMKVEEEVKDLISKYLEPDSYVLDVPPMSMKIGNHTVQGHADGLLLKPEKMVLEIKSINTQGFSYLPAKGIPDSYKAQATFYMAASGIDRSLFLFYDKNLSDMTELPYFFDQKLWRKIHTRFTNVIESNKTHLPDREFEPNDKGVLPWECSYCAYIRHCWPTAELTIKTNRKPMFTVKKEEVTT
jgi:hypothetical protein